MKTQEVFVVDASSWICLHEEYYCPEIFPALWTRLHALAAMGRIRVPTKAIAEIGEKEGVGAWLRTIKPSVVPKLTPAIAEAVKVVNVDFPELVKDYSGRDADPWLVAYGMKCGWVVVTEERLSPGKPKVPNACAKYAVQCIGATEMLRRLGIKWEDETERSSGSIRLQR